MFTSDKPSLPRTSHRAGYDQDFVMIRCRRHPGEAFDAPGSGAGELCFPYDVRLLAVGFEDEADQVVDVDADPAALSCARRLRMRQMIGVETTRAMQLRSHRSVGKAWYLVPAARLLPSLQTAHSRLQRAFA